MPRFERFDSRHYVTVSVRDGYREWLPTYESTVEDLMDIALLDRIESVRFEDVERAADLGCGTGRTGEWLRSRGATEIDGVDLTPEMLDVARERGVYERIAVADVRSTGLDSGAYDIVTCCLVDEHLEELGALYLEATRLMRPGASLVLLGYHPFFMMSAGMPTHFDHPDGHPVAIETHVHLISDHVAASRAAGCGLVEMHEGIVDDDWIRRKPSWDRYRDWPISFVCVWRSSASGIDGQHG